MTDFADVINPTEAEVRRWAYANDGEPVEDFDTVIGQPELLPTLIDLVGDPACPQRDVLLGGLYCLVGHTPLDDPRIGQAVTLAGASSDPWLRTWADRTTRVLADPASLRRDDWCNEDGYRIRPT